jgi:DNA-binding transcriptional regulator YhcF (GntR family)
MAEEFGRLAGWRNAAILDKLPPLGASSAMNPLRLLTAAEQVAAHLRHRLELGQWANAMPGVNPLAAELGVNHKTVEAALRELERDGLLVGQGPGRCRRIVQPKGRAARAMRLAFLLYERADRRLEYLVELQHALVEAGHTVAMLPRTLVELGMDVLRVSRLVRQTPADAWVVCAGSRALLEWFSARPAPVFALFGRRDGLPIAATGPDKLPALLAATRRLIALGHRRIVLLVQRERRLPEPGRTERAFLELLAAHGLPVGDFNLPDWEETPAGFHERLRLLFQVTPPTALIIDSAPLFVAAQQFLAGRRLRVPDEVSLICTDPNLSFEWCVPTVAHIAWDSAPVVRRVVRWASVVSRGWRDGRQTLTPAEFIPGGTIGPAPPADRLHPRFAKAVSITPGRD